jgi:uncharacterized protein YkwD
VGSKLILVVTAALLAGLATASSAAAVALHNQRVVAAPSQAASSSAGPLIAPPAACPGQESLDAPAAAQEGTMACMVDFARRQFGLGELAQVEALHQSALDKAADILSCDSFSHFACGREFTYWMKATGYMSAPCWRVGENLAWGSGEYGSVRSIFLAWMRSPTHRENLLGDYDETGISLAVGTLDGQPGTHVWAEHFGSHCD